MALADSTNTSPHLLKGIGLLAAIALMLTNAIGTGVFLKARVMICNVGTPGMVLFALPGRSLAGLGLIALGLPVYFYYTPRRSKPQRDDGLESDRSS